MSMRSVVRQQMARDGSSQEQHWDSTRTCRWHMSKLKPLLAADWCERAIWPFSDLIGRTFDVGEGPEWGYSGKKGRGSIFHWLEIRKIKEGASITFAGDNPRKDQTSSESTNGPAQAKSTHPSSLSLINLTCRYQLDQDRGKKHESIPQIFHFEKHNTSCL